MVKAWNVRRLAAYGAFLSLAWVVVRTFPYWTQGGAYTGRAIGSLIAAPFVGAVLVGGIAFLRNRLLGLVE